MFSNSNLKSVYIFSVISVLLIFSLAACKKQPTDKLQNKSKTDIIITLGSDEPEGGFDPCVGWGRYGSPLIQSTLLETDKDMQLVKDLASSYYLSNDRKHLTFMIRKDVKFTDGTPLTANDVAFTFNTAKNSGSIVDLTDMDEVTATDNYTVVFKLKKPSSAFLYTIALTGIVPEHAYGKNYSDEPIGSGPYKLAKWDKGQQIILTANEDYYGKTPEIKKVTLVFMSEDAAFASAKAGTLDIAYTSPNLAINQIKNMNLARLKTIDNRGITLPVNKYSSVKNSSGKETGNNVTSDIAIRKALTYGIDREKLVKDVINGFGTPAYTECDGMPWWNENSVIRYNIENAKKILDNASWRVSDNGVRVKNGVRAEFTILYPSNDAARQAIATSVKEQAKSLGIDITLLGLSWDEIYPRMYKNAVLMGWGAQNPVESYLLYHSDNKGRDAHNPENFSNKKVDEYMAKAMQSADPDESLEFWKKAQWDGVSGTSSLGEAPIVWLVNMEHLYYVKSGLDIGEQKIHPHGHAWPLVANLRDWRLITK